MNRIKAIDVFTLMLTLMAGASFAAVEFGTRNVIALPDKIFACLPSPSGMYVAVICRNKSVYCLSEVGGDWSEPSPIGHFTSYSDSLSWVRSGTREWFVALPPGDVTGEPVCFFPPGTARAPDWRSNPLPLPTPMPALIRSETGQQLLEQHLRRIAWRSPLPPADDHARHFSNIDNAYEGLGAELLADRSTRVVLHPTDSRLLGVLDWDRRLALVVDLKTNVAYAPLRREFKSPVGLPVLSPDGEMLLFRCGSFHETEAGGNKPFFRRLELWDRSGSFHSVVDWFSPDDTFWTPSYVHWLPTGWIVYGDAREFIVRKVLQGDEQE